jgi:hypothetical protein
LAERICEVRVLLRQDRGAWEDRRKVMLKEMLQQAASNGSSEVPIRVTTPPRGEVPDWLWIELDEAANLDDLLPAGVNLSVWCCNAGENGLSLANGFFHCHSAPPNGSGFSCTSQR